MDKIKVTDYEEVLATVAKYTESCKEGKSDIMKPAFTENALMYGYLNGEYYNGSIEALYGAVNAFGPAPETKARVDVLSIEGTAAVVRVTLEAWEQGVGSVWVRLFDVDAVAKAFSLPANIKPVCLLPVGYATEDSVPYATWHDVYRPIEDFVEEL